MKEFFSSKPFKIIAVLLALVLAFLLRAIYTGSLMPFVSNLGGAITAPVSEMFAGISSGVTDFLEPVFRGHELQRENEELRKRLDELTDRQVDYDTLKNQNELYREFFRISDRHVDYTLEPATVIARVTEEATGAFVINVGSNHGIKAGMPVITEYGLVGIVNRVSSRYSQVDTLLDPAVSVGVLDSATLDTGVVSGDAELMTEGYTRVNFIRLESTMTAGDIILTSGYGDFIPQGLIVGYVHEVGLDSTGLTRTATVLPAADPDDARQVFVITDYTETEAPAEGE